MDDDQMTPYDHMVGIRTQFARIEASLGQLDPYTLAWLYAETTELADGTTQSQYGDLVEHVIERVEILEPSM